MVDSVEVKAPVRNKRTWTPEEDEKLVEALMKLHATGKYAADNGFRPGYFQAVQKLLDVSLPNSGLKAEPHIKSRLKMLRTHFNIMHDMVLGSSTSGFGWNPDQCILTAHNDVWNEYLKRLSIQSHKNASIFNDKTFPFYHKFAIICGKDRATCSRAVDLGDEEVVVETQKNIPTDLEDIDIDMEIGTSRGGKAGKNNKRKRGKSVDFICVYSESCNKLNNTLVAIGNEMNNNLNKMVADATPNLELMMKVQSELDDLPNVTFEEAIEAGDVIGTCPLKTERFLGYDKERKVGMVKMFARKSTR